MAATVSESIETEKDFVYSQIHDEQKWAHNMGKREETIITILPGEIIFNILIWLPAHLLYNVVRYVCRQWYRIVGCPQFLSTHFLLSMSSSTLLMYSRERSLYYLLDVRERHAKFSGFEFHLPPTYNIYTCNGLMLILRMSRRLANCAYYVGNPITRRTLALPQLSLPILPFYCGLAFEASSKVYKVVAVYKTDKYSSKRLNIDVGCAILTVGTDEAWRFLNCAHLTKEDMTILDERPPITSTEFVYFVPRSDPYMLALDLKSESIKRISLPFPCGFPNLYSSNYLPKGNSISVWYVNSNFSMEVWLLKDYISEEWIKILYIDGKPIRNELAKVMSPNQLDPGSRNYHFIFPRSWLENGERILFHVVFDNVPHIFVYDLNTHGCYPFSLENGESFSSVLVPFVNSLGWVC